MGLMSRFSTIVKAKASKLLDRAEDPRETLDYSYERQLEMLQKVRRGVADVATAKKRIELQAAKLEQSVTKLDSQARQALAANREDLARIALERKKGVQLQLQALDQQRAQLQAEQEKLVAAEQRLTAKVEAFRTQKETIKAQYTAAEAQVRIGEAVTGVSEEMADVGLAIERAEQKTETMRARAGAIDELIESGTLTDLTAGGRDEIDRELERMSVASGVDAELAALKKEIGAGGGGSSGQLGAGEGAS
jgi:phage shock protein A